MEILNQKYTITWWGMEKIRELKSKSDYFQKYFIEVMNRKNGTQNSEKKWSVWRGVSLVNDTDLK